jgi:hypothetical protein
MVRPKTALAERIEPEEPSLRDEIRRLVELGRVEEARRIVREELARGEQARELGRWPELLAMPKVVARPKTGRGDSLENMRWIEAHRDEHRGEWVALRDGALVDSDPSRIALANRLLAKNALDGVLFIKLDE